MDRETFRVLIVEDDRADEALLRMRVGNLYPHAKVMSAVSVSDAYQTLRNNQFDLILLDLNLPDGFGPTSVSEMREFKKDIPIIVVTNMGTDIAVVEALKAGANNVVLKSDISDEDFKNIMDQNLQL